MTTTTRSRSIPFAVVVAVLTCAPASAEAPAPRTSQQAVADMTTRAPDAFYAPPEQVPDRSGALLRHAPLAGATLPAGMRGWRILYTTTVDDATRATAVAVVLAPTDPPAGPRPVIAWAHPTTGALQACMPSLFSDPTVGLPARDGIVRAGWVVVATDYSFAEPGGPHPYLIGEGEARAVLDAVRAARQLPALTLDPRTVVWGHSQGGHAALWTGMIGPRYAPDVPLAGIAAIAPAADVAQVLALNRGADKRLGPYIALAYSRFYPDIAFAQALRPQARAAAGEMAKLCLFLPREDPQRIVALASTFDGPSLAVDASLAARLAQNAAGGPIAAPLLVAQGLSDVVVPPAATEPWLEGRCAAGQRLDYWSFAGMDHARIVLPGTPLDAPLLAWTAARFAGEPQAAGCARKTFAAP